MINRHHPRTYGSWARPTAGRRDDRWSCGTTWTAVPGSPVVPGTAPVEPELLP